MKRQYSGTLGKIGNCQIAVSVHAVGERGTLPLGWRALSARGVVRRSARVGARRRSPTRSASRRSRSLLPAFVEQAAGWELPAAPILADCAYGDDTALPHRRCTRSELEYVLAVSAKVSVYGPETSFAVPERNGTVGRPRTVARPDRKPESVRALADAAARERLADAALPHHARPARTSASRFAFVRVVATNPVRNRHLPPREEWLIIEWPDGAEAPSDYWLSNLPADSRPRAARPARPAALDDRARLPPAQRRARARPLRGPQLPRLPPPHARSSPAPTPSSRSNGSTQKPRGRPDTAAGGAAPAARPALLGRPLPNLPTARRPRTTHPLPPT